MGDTVLNTTIKEKDLGITISADMKVSEQYGLIRRNIVYKEIELIIPIIFRILYTSMEAIS
jgi:hypothetical protein